MFKTLGYVTDLSYSKSPEKRLCWDSNITADKRENCLFNDVNFRGYIASDIHEILVCVYSNARTNKGLWRGQNASCRKSNTTHSVHFGSMMDKVVLERIRLLLFPLTVSFHQCPPFIHSTLSVRRCMSLAADSIVK
jgi:hypothetical protein